MNTILIAIAFLLGIFSADQDTSTITEEQQQQIEQIVIEDYNQI